jgi:hypothetical protein
MTDAIAVDFVDDVVFAGERIFEPVRINRAAGGEGAEEWGGVGGVWAEDGVGNGGADAVLAGGGGVGGGVVEDEGAVVLDRQRAWSAVS